MSTHPGSAAPLPLSMEERENVLVQLSRLLETHHFRHSRRYPALLRFIVEETLEGRGEFLKERLLGVRVFDRPANYDTAADPVVRVTIAEIRKRIAQYYHDEEHDAEMRIELQPGSYAPEFRLRGALRNTRHAAAVESTPSAAIAMPDLADKLPAPAVSSAPAAAAAVRLGARRRPWKIWYLCVASALVLLGLAACAFFLRWGRPTASEQFWAPLLRSQRSILFCLPTNVDKKRGTPEEFASIDNLRSAGKSQNARAAGPSFLAYQALGENVVYSDVQAMLSMVNVVAAHHHDYSVRLNVSTTLEDLRQGPSVLIGGLDNQWTMRALAPLRFHMSGSDAEGFWIVDEKNPGMRDWSLNMKEQIATVTRDYAIVARLHNDQTGQPQIIVAGIGMSGTAAAGEFLGDPQRVEQLSQQIGGHFKDRDFEVVLRTDVVNGISGSAKIIALELF